MPTTTELTPSEARQCAHVGWTGCFADTQRLPVVDAWLREHQAMPKKNILEHSSHLFGGKIKVALIRTDTLGVI